MKSFLTLAAMAFLTLAVQAREMLAWTYQELFDKADLVAIGRPISTTETKEESNLSDIFPNVAVVGLSTNFELGLVMKGENSTRKIVLHHYRVRDSEILENGPFLAAFDPKQNASFLLFLKREADGRYAPVTGQTDPMIQSISKVSGAALYPSQRDKDSTGTP